MTTKQKMTSSYKAVFVFSILMIFVGLVSSTARHGYSAASVIWGIQTWYIYKQRNAELVGGYIALLWLGGIAFAIISLFLLLDTNAAIYGFSYITLIEIAVMMAIYYGMLQFFKQQLVTPSVTNTNNANYLNAEQEFKSELKDIELWKKCYVEAGGNAAIAKKIYIKSRADKKVVVKQDVVTQDEDLSSYIQAMSEIRSNNKEEGLWIKCFAENDGDTARTEAAYIKYRVNKINSNAISNKNINDVQNEYADTPAFDLIEKKLYTIKEHNKKPYWLLKNNNAAIQANQIIYVYSNETDCKNAINSGELSLGVKLAIKA